MADTMSTAKDNLQRLGKSAGEAANTASENVRSAAGVVGEKVQDMASSVSKSAEAAASYVGERAEDATAAAGSRIRAAGDAIRQNAPHEGRLGQASEAVARTFEDTGAYVEEQGLEGMARDFANMVRRNPIPALLIGVGLAVWLTARSISDRR